MTHAFHYEQADIPPGMTLRDWRVSQRPARRPSVRLRIVRWMLG